MSIIIRLQNLPWAADSVDIRRYFAGLSIPEGGVHIVGGEMGDAFIAFSTDEDARLAMEKDGGKIHEMQIKLLLSSRTEMMRVIEKARQQNLALQAQMLPPIQPPPPLVQLQQPTRNASPSVESDRRRTRSPSPVRRRSRDKSPPRDRRRSPDSRRFSSKRDRSRSPVRNRSNMRDTDRRNDRYKREDRRYDDSSRYRDDRYSGRTHSQDNKKYPDTDSRQGSRMQSAGDFRDSSSRGFYDTPSTTSNATSSYNYDVSRSMGNSKDYPSNFYDSPSEKSSLARDVDRNNLAAQNSIPLNQLNIPSSDSYTQLPPSFASPFEPQTSLNKPSVPVSVADDSLSKRPRRTRFEPDYAQSTEPPFFPNPTVDEKSVLGETVCEGLSYNNKRPTNEEYHPPARNTWPIQNEERPQNTSWTEKRPSLLEPPDLKNRDFMNVVPMELESPPPAEASPEKIIVNEPDPFNSRARAGGMEMSRPEDSIRNNRVPVTNDKWVGPPSSTIEVRGIPSDVRMNEVLDIFRNIPLSPANVCIQTNNQGAEKALIRFSKLSDFDEATNGEPRYIRNYRCEILPSTDAAFEAAAALNSTKPRSKPKPREEDLCVQLRGLPFSSKENDIVNFFDPLRIIDMVIERSPNGKCSGMAVVHFASPQDFRSALMMNGKMIGQRYITISVSSKELLMNVRGVDFNSQIPRAKSPSYNSVAMGNNFDPLRRPKGPADSSVLNQVPPQVLPSRPLLVEQVPAPRPLLDEAPSRQLLDQTQSRQLLDQAPSSHPLLDQGPSSCPLLDQTVSCSPLDHVPPPPHSPNQKRSDNYCINIRGLREHVTNKAIAEFFSDIGINVKAIHLMLTPRNTPSGEAFIELGTKEEADIILKNDGNLMLGEPVFVRPISFQEMIGILEGPPAILPPPAPGPLLKTPASSDRTRRPLLPQAPNERHFSEQPHLDQSENESESFDANDGPGFNPESTPEYYDQPRGPRPRPSFIRGERPHPDFHRGDRARQGYPRGERPNYARGERPRMESPMRGMRPFMERPARPPYGRMRGPFPPRPGGPVSRGPPDFGAPGCVVAINNLHFKAGLEELLDFFKGYMLTKDSIIRKFNENGHPTAEARVAFQNPRDAERVVRELNRKPIMGRSLMLSLV